MSRRTSKLLTEPGLPFSPSLAKAIGMRSAIIIEHLNSMLYDRGTDVNGRLWVKLSIKDWCRELPFVNDRTMREPEADAREWIDRGND